MGVFEYLQLDQVAQARRRVASGLVQEMERAEGGDMGMYGAAITMRTMLTRYNSWIEDFAQTWLSDHIQEYENAIILHRPANAAQLLKDLRTLKGKIKDMTIPKFFDN